MGNMVKFLKQGKVVIVLGGRYAGKKAVIVKNFDDGSAERRYGYAVIAGVERAPLKVTKTMGQRRIAKRSKVKSFVKIVNYSHLMPTRYSLEVDLKSTVTLEDIQDPATRSKTRKEVRKVFEE